MDPTACVAFILNASDATPAQVREHGAALLEWMRRGGFVPAQFPGVFGRADATRLARLSAGARSFARVSAVRREFLPLVRYSAEVRS